MLQIDNQGDKIDDENYEYINSPSHYNDHPANIECIDVIEEFPANVAMAIKHQWRCGLKPGVDPQQDLDKAIWYLQREKLRLERKKEPKHELKDTIYQDFNRAKLNSSTISEVKTDSNFEQFRINLIFNIARLSNLSVDELSRIIPEHYTETIVSDPC